MDRIRVEGLTLHLRIGVSEQERRNPQPIVLDLEVQLDLDRACRSDDLADSVDYSALVRRLQRGLESEEFRLLERAADQACRLVLQEDRIRDVRVLARKFPSSLSDCVDSVSVERRLSR